MFDRQFSLALEIAITATFKQSSDPDQRRCWCNDVVLPENSSLYSIEQVLKTRQLIAKVWIDEGRGEDEAMQYLYEMKLNFGDKSIESLKNGDRLDALIPDGGIYSWIFLDKHTKSLTFDYHR